MRFIAGVLWMIAAFGLVSAAAAAPAQQPEGHPPVSSQNTKSGSYLGVGVVDVDSGRLKSLAPDSETGVQVMHLRDGSPAQKAGLRVGDVLLSYNGENILGGQQLGRLVAETPVGRHVKLKFWRDGNVQTCVVTTAPAPDVTSELQSNMRELGEQMGRLRFSMPMDVPTPLLVWRNRMLGIVVEPLDPQLADYFGVRDGVLVRLVEKGSPADAAGIRSGDVVTSVGGQQVSSPRDLSMCMRNQTTTAQISVSLTRNHKPMKLNVTPAVDNPQ